MDGRTDERRTGRPEAPRSRGSGAQRRSGGPMTPTTNVPRYRADALVGFAHALLAKAGVRDDIARDVATVLVDGDLLGHNTHGLALLAGYLGETREGLDGEERRAARDQLAPRGAGVGWPAPARPVAHAARVRHRDEDGRHVRYGHRRDPPLASHRVPRGVPEARHRPAAWWACCSAPIRRGAASRRSAPCRRCSRPTRWRPAFRRPAIRSCSTSRRATRPTASRSACSTPARSCRIRGSRTRRATPRPTRPCCSTTPKGTLLPLGGLDAGHKGYALALLIEACTGALAGFGRADPSEGWGATVFVQVLDPEAFGGRADYTRQMDWLANACHAATPRPGGPPVRLPGENGMKRHREQTAKGVALFPAIMPALAPWGEKLGVPLPAAVVKRRRSHESGAGRGAARHRSAQFRYWRCRGRRFLPQSNSPNSSTTLRSRGQPHPRRTSQ